MGMKNLTIMKIKQKILNFLEKTEKLKTGKIYLDISKITKKELAMLKQEKYNLKDYIHSMDLDAVKHVQKRHVNITHQDFLLIPLIYSSPDFVCYDDKKRCFIYKKRIEKEYFYIEEIRNKNRRLSLKTFYKRRLPRPERV